MIFDKRAVLGAIAIALLASGCSGGVSRTADVQVSAQDMVQSQIFRANQFLNSIEKLPPGQRQLAANMPTSAEALYAAYQSDPATKKRIDDLGLKVSAPPPKTGPGHRPIGN
jgi:hypothetical protein